MAERRITIDIAIDLARSSKEAHAVTIKKIADQIGEEAVKTFEARGYRVRAATVNTLMHYVRHDMTTVLRKARRLKVVKGA